MSHAYGEYWLATVNKTQEHTYQEGKGVKWGDPKFQQLVAVPNPEICEQVEALDNEGSWKQSVCFSQQNKVSVLANKTKSLF
jgi:hypothetical protein